MACRAVVTFATLRLLAPPSRLSRLLCRWHGGPAIRPVRADVNRSSMISRRDKVRRAGCFPALLASHNRRVRLSAVGHCDRPDSPFPDRAPADRDRRGRGVLLRRGRGGWPQDRSAARSRRFGRSLWRGWGRGRRHSRCWGRRHSRCWGRRHSRCWGRRQSGGCWTEDRGIGRARTCRGYSSQLCHRPSNVPTRDAPNGGGDPRERRRGAMAS